MAVAKIWRNRLEAGTQKWEDCPDKYKPKVNILLREDVENGVITAERYEEITGEPYGK